ncbi:MAG: hypothetical protein IT550_00255 [Novosphingobium sp.]|nr:hypothetical protein [Novosphingobium sp.]
MATSPGKAIIRRSGAGISAARMGFPCASKRRFAFAAIEMATFCPMSSSAQEAPENLTLETARGFRP